MGDAYNSDINKLYGAAIYFPLPTGGFKWVPVKQFYNLNIHNLLDAAKVGYILEVDIKCPFELYELHKNLPMCPKKMTPPGGKQSKLTTLFKN